MIHKITLLLVYLSVTLSISGEVLEDGWKFYNKTNCFNNTGATHLEKHSNVNVERCKSLCTTSPGCEGFVYGEADDGQDNSECGLRNNIVIDKCVPDTYWKMYIRPENELKLLQYEKQLKELKDQCLNKDDELLNVNNENSNLRKECDEMKNQLFQLKQKNEIPILNNLNSVPQFNYENSIDYSSEEHKYNFANGLPSRLLTDIIPTALEYDEFKTNLPSEYDQFAIYNQNNISNSNNRFEYEVIWPSNADMPFRYKENTKVYEAILIDCMVDILRIQRDSIKVTFQKRDAESFSATYDINDELITEELLNNHKLAIRELLNEAIIKNKESDRTDFFTTLGLDCGICYTGFTDTDFIKNPNCQHKFCEKCTEKLHPGCGRDLPCPICRDNQPVAKKELQSLKVKNDKKKNIIEKAKESFKNALSVQSFNEDPNTSSIFKTTILEQEQIYKNEWVHITNKTSHRNGNSNLNAPKKYNQKNVKTFGEKMNNYHNTIRDETREKNRIMEEWRKKKRGYNQIR
jgi:hypothetical protein